MTPLKFIQRPFFDFTAWYEMLVTYTALSFIGKDGKEHIIKSFPTGTIEKEHPGSMHGYLRNDVQSGKEEMKAMQEAIQKNDGRWIDLYMNWPYHLKETKGMSPLEMIQWVRGKG